MNFRIALRLFLSVVIIAASLKTAQVFWEKREDTKEAFQQEVELFHQNEERKGKLQELVGQKKQLDGQVEEAETESAEVVKHREEIAEKIEQDKEPLAVLDQYKEEFLEYQNDFDVLDLYNLTYFEGKYDQNGIDEVAYSNKITNVAMEIGKYLPGMELLTSLLGNCMQSNNTAYYEYMEKLNNYLTDNMQKPMVELSQAIQRMHAKLEFYHSFVDEDNSLTEQYRNVRLLTNAADRIWKLDEIYEEREDVAKAADTMVTLLEEAREIYRFVLDEDSNWEYFDTLDQMIDDNRNLGEQMKGDSGSQSLSRKKRYRLLADYIDLYCKTIDEACSPILSANITGMNCGHTDVPSTAFMKGDGFRMYRYFNTYKNDALTYLAGGYDYPEEKKFEIYYYMNGQPARAYFKQIGTLYFDIYGEELSGTVDQDTAVEIYNHLEWFVDNYLLAEAGKEARDRFAPYVW